jgi:hypothetical protein
MNSKKYTQRLVVPLVSRIPDYCSDVWTLLSDIAIETVVTGLVIT